MQFLWKIGGEAGFGVMTTGMMFAKIAMRSGYYVYDYTEYPSLIRGGHNTTDVMVSDEPVTAVKRQIDLLVCLNKETYDLHADRVGPSTLVIHDADEYSITGDGISIHVPFRRIKREEKVQQIMMNTIAMGASLTLLSADRDVYYDLLAAQFGAKGQKIVDLNKHLAERGASIVSDAYSSKIQKILPPRKAETQMLVSGNDVFSLATVAADCRLYVAYPMTPSSTVLASLAAWERKTKMIVRHAEDEIAVILSALGSSAMGVRSAVGTSGGGFALMVEAVSFAGIAEVPIVVFMSQRPGPATGMPTWTEQGDLLFTVNAGHGEFPKIVLAPGDAIEMAEMTLHAYNLADQYQVPVIVLSDKLLSESHQSIPAKTISDAAQKRPIDRGKIVNKPEKMPYHRYALSADGISEWVLPGAKEVSYQANSYEHSIDSHTSETAEDRVQQVEKRAQKMQTYLKKDYVPPVLIGEAKDAKAVILSWGGNKNPVLAAQSILSQKGIAVSYLHSTHLHPVDGAKIASLIPKDVPMILVENNATGQFGSLLRMQTGLEIEHRFLRYDGRPIDAEELANYVESIIHSDQA